MSPLASINAFYQAIIDKDIDAIHQSYFQQQDTYVTLKGSGLAISRFSNIAKSWIDFCGSDLFLKSIEWEERPKENIGEELARIAGVIKLIIDVKGKTFEQIFRASFILHREEEQWKIRDEHLSGALEDPYGIGDWLKK